MGHNRAGANRKKRLKRRKRMEQQLERKLRREILTLTHFLKHRYGLDQHHHHRDHREEK